MTTVILCGMREEYDIARVIPGVVVFWGQAREHLEDLLPGDTSRIITFGVCGGLAPDVQVGDLVVGALYGDDTRLANDLASRLPCFWGYIYSDGKEEADTKEQRAALFKSSHCWAIDDETYFAAAAAKERHLPYCAVRAVSDAWNETLPYAARHAMNQDGTVNVGSVLASLGSHPSQIFDLTRVARNFDKALASLRRAATVLGS